MTKARFSNAEVAAAVEEFEVYMAPRFVQASGRNGDIKVYGENPNAHKSKPIVYDDEEYDSGVLQEPSN